MPHTSSGMYWEHRGQQRSSQSATIVVLPGFGGCIGLLEALAHQLRGHRLLLFDLPGHGASTAAPASGELPELSKIVHDAIAESGATSYHLLGYSLGGSIALRIAGDHPSEVRSLIGLAPWNAAGTTPDDPVMAGFDASYGNRDALRQAVAAISTVPDRTAGLVDAMLGVTSQMWHGWLAAGALRDHSAELPEVQVPTCYIVAGRDAVIDPIEQIRDARRIPHSRVVLLNELGHLCGLEAPDLVAHEINAYLATVR